MSTSQLNSKNNPSKSPRPHTRTKTYGKGALSNYDSTGYSDDEDYDDWVEFENEIGEKLYLNRTTNAVRLTDPKTHAGPDLDKDGKPWGGKVDQIPFYPKDLDPTARIRQTGLRRHDVHIVAHGSPQKQSSPKKIDAEEEKAEQVLRKMVDNIGKMCFDLDRISNYGMNVQEESMEEIKEIKEKLNFIHEQLEEGKQLMDDRNDVDALIDFKHLSWDWDNRSVHYYRATALDRNHPPFNQWHFPEYFSTLPMPQCEDGRRIMHCQVFFPPNASKTGALHTQVSINETKLVGDVISEALKKCRPDKDHSYVLKALGFAEYMDPERKIFDYEHIRLKARDGAQRVDVSLVEKPSPLPAVDLTQMRKEYASKLDGMEYITPITEKTHQNIPDLLKSLNGWKKMHYTAMAKVNLPLKFRICGLEDVKPNILPILAEQPCTTIQLEIFLFHGIKVIESSRFRTKEIQLSAYPRWMQWFPGTPGGETNISNLPRDVRVGFILYGKSLDQKKMHELAYFVLQLVDCTGKLTTGKQSFRMWAFPSQKGGGHGKKREVDPNFIFRATNRENLHSKEVVTLRVDFAEYLVPIVAPILEVSKKPNPMVVGDEIKDITPTEFKKIEKLKKMDALAELSKQDCEVLWKFRHSISKTAHMLPKFLQSVQWGKPDHRWEARRLLEEWEGQQTMVHVLELLDVKYPDYYVRKYAVKKLQQLEDEELQFYLLQITQCLKFQPYHDSPLARCLIDRALRNPHGVGHYFFWHLKAEMHNCPEFAERYAMILEEYLSHCGRHAANLRNQNNAVLKMQRVSALIVRLKREEAYGDEIAMKEYTKELNKLNKTFFKPMGKFQIPLDPKWEATTLIVNKCRYMSSKMVPLWLTFNNADSGAKPHIVMFKSGDDLRQDILTLQLLCVMDKLWLAQGLDLKLRPYKCIATGINENGEGVGMIEIVLNSDTTSGIQLKYYGAVGAIRMDPIQRFLKDNNKDNYKDAQNNFVASCAGYCVATYVLGIGDRHNGNIMVTKDGHLFHIDFGHFLGNFKKKFGVNRERAAFVFTPEMAYVIGGRKYKNDPLFQKFLGYCNKAFGILRDNAIMLEILFMLMVSAGMPELLVEKDILYLREKLNLDVKKEKAEKKLKSEINKSLDCTYRRFDNMIHNFKHG